MRKYPRVRFPLLAVAAGGLLWTAAPPARADTMTGEIVDLTCYMQDPGRKGAGHKKCAQTCIAMNLPMGLLAEDQQAYVLLEDPDNPKPYAQLKDKAAEKVTIDGDRVAQGGVQGIVVKAVK